MGYPQKLLPKSSYSLIDENNNYLNKLYLVRAIPNKHQNFDDNGKLVHTGLGRTAQLPQYSINLLGVFKAKHSKIKFTSSNNSFTSYWQSGELSERPRYNEIKVDDNRGALFLKYEKVKNYPVSTVSNGTEFRYRLFLKHKPTKCNFWHFEIKWFDEVRNEEVTIQENKGKAKIRNVPKAVSFHMRTIYIQLGIEKPKKIPKLPVKYYKN